ncbi:MAG: HyaD/HybD family hydrogenase maturation endopeptidase [Desulfobacterales bacterium]|nr:HyaD/HybD family hydrogenase maturation endopeptidase [Desulfobacterales bacterium]
MDILVLGIGNVLLMDEGVGVKAVEELDRRYSFPQGVELLDGGTSGIELLTHIRNRDAVIIIDAMTWGRRPGSVGRVEGRDVPAAFLTRISPHQLGLSDLLAAAMLTDELPGHLVLFGVEPQFLEAGFSLSPAVTANFEKLLTAVLDELRRLGCDEIQPQTRTITPSPWAYSLHNGNACCPGKEPS